MLHKQVNFRVPKAFTFQASEAKFKLLFSITSLACMRITNQFHPNYFALKQRLEATRK